MGKYRMRKFKRRKKLSRSRLTPILIVFGIIIGVGLIAGGVKHFALPFIQTAFLPLPNTTETPVPTGDTPVNTPEATAAIPNVLDDFDPFTAMHEIVPQVPDQSEYRWFGDPYYYDGTILFTGGKLIDNNAIMCSLFLYSADESRVTVEYEHELLCDHFMYPQMNEKYIVFLDAGFDGGGYITCYDRTKVNAMPQIVKQVYVGQPEIKLWEHYLVWTERTGTRMDKLFVCDLDTMETVTLAMFNDSVYGQSIPSIMNGMLVWADAQNGGASSGATSTINHIRIEGGSQYSFETDTYVHDPEGNGRYFAWLDSHHAENGKLYGSKGPNAPFVIAENVLEFGLYDDYVIYSKDETVWLYAFKADKHYRLTSVGTSAQFMGTSNGAVFWLDVTQRGNDILMYLTLPSEDME